MPPSRRSASRKLATVAGIEIQFHASWVIILLLIGLTLGEYFRAANASWTNLTVVVAAGITTVAFFVSVILHELAHSLVARAHGLPVRVITLFVFGGVSELTREPDDAASEFKIAIAGPGASVVLGAIFLGLAQLFRPHTPAFLVLEWLGWINLILAIFNLVPGFPLDGGRVLRAIFWSAGKNFVNATRWATRVGKVCALAMILAGVWEFFQGASLSGLWLAFIGWFLLSAAEQSWRQTEIQSAISQYRVRDLSTPFYARVSPDVSLEEFINELSASHRYRASLVMDHEDELLGIITAADLNRVPRALWPTTPVRQIMVPRAAIATVSAGEELTSALRKMAEQDVGQLPIVDDGSVSGVIRRDRIIELLQAQLTPGH